MNQYNVRLRCTAECVADILVDADSIDEAKQKAISEVSDLDWSTSNVDDDSVEVDNVENLGEQDDDSNS